MTDLNKLRSEFESNEYIKSIIQNFEWSEEFNNYQIKDFVINGNIFDLLEVKNDEQLLNGAWFGWQEKAKAQAVPEGYVVVPKVPTEKFKEDLKQHLDELWWGDHGCDWDGFVSVNGIDPLKIYALAIVASESGAEG